MRVDTCVRLSRERQMNWVSKATLRLNEHFPVFYRAFLTYHHHYFHFYMRWHVCWRKYLNNYIDKWVRISCFAIIWFSVCFISVNDVVHYWQKYIYIYKSNRAMGCLSKCRLQNSWWHLTEKIIASYLPLFHWRKRAHAQAVFFLSIYLSLPLSLLTFN